jgi:hypothetical protein
VRAPQRAHHLHETVEPGAGGVGHARDRILAT